MDVASNADQFERHISRATRALLYYSWSPKNAFANAFKHPLLREIAHKVKLSPAPREIGSTCRANA